MLKDWPGPFLVDINWPDYLGAAVWPHDEALFIDNFIGRWSVEAIRTHDFAKPLTKTLNMEA